MAVTTKNNSSKRKQPVQKSNVKAKKAKVVEKEPESEIEESSEDELDNASSSGSDISDSDNSENEDEDELDIDENESSDKPSGEVDPNKKTSKEQHAEQKKLRDERKLSKPNGEKIQHIKQIWERLRVKKDIPSGVRKKLLDEAWAASKDQIKELVLKHDASRVVQTMFKYSDKEKRMAITKALKGTYVELARSSYGKYLLVKLLHYGSKEVREDVLNELYGNFRKLMRHREGAYVIEDAYRDYATAAQKRQIVREFYGSEFAIFKDHAKDMSLADIIKENPEKRPFLMKNLKETISAAVQKGSIGFTIIHAAMLEYVKNIDPTTSEKDEFIDIVTEQFAEMVHTNEGSQVACRVLAMATPKERKLLVRSLKDFVDKLAEDEYGNFVLITLFNTVDDTVSVHKAFSSKLQEHMPELLAGKFGRRPFIYLLLGFSPRYFTKSVLDATAELNKIKAATSKKDDDVRREELKNKFSQIMLDGLVTYPKAVLSESFGSQAASEVLLYAEGDKTAALEAVANAFSGSPDNEEHLIQLPFSSRTLRTLIQEGHWNSKTKSVDTINEPTGFKNIFFKAIKLNISRWASGEGSFVILSLLENLDDKEELLSLLKEKSVLKEIKKAAEEGNKGSKLILEQL
ncbi:hypothetical protein DV451_001325 [Geotrichum candidum]|uniref:PUM-HD domain-containing protein n=1 Tax=Geotrichum candidum TaxID=1173061 RepID=A0A9P5KVR2_GEOCN|nr:hypothetical protein DV451_001325 [Geotrichum candidum]KAF5110893.1 hypothetical protein DV453_000594 [Geotrichum candidum]